MFSAKAFRERSHFDEEFLGDNLRLQDCYLFSSYEIIELYGQH